jgi:hypothetical protein
MAPMAPTSSGGKKKRRKDGETGAIRHPFRYAAPKLIGDARRIARAAFKGAKPIIAPKEPPPALPAGSDDELWFCQDQAGPNYDAGEDYSPPSHLSPGM